MLIIFAARFSDILYVLILNWRLIDFFFFFRDDSNPKTIDQIQKEAERETLEMNLALNSPQERKRQDPRNMLDNKRRKFYLEIYSQL